MTCDANMTALCPLSNLHCPLLGISGVRHFLQRHSQSIGPQNVWGQLFGAKDVPVMLDVGPAETYVDYTLRVLLAGKKT